MTLRSALKSGAGYHLLVFLLISLFIVQPWAAGTAMDPRLIPLLYALIFAIALASVAPKRNLVTVGLALFIPSVAIAILPIDPVPRVTVIGNAFAMAFLFLMIGTFLHRIFNHPAVTAATISGSICVYLFLGIAWAIAFETMAVLDPSAFTDLGDLSGEERSSALFYFSFTTLTTLGYGDIAPLSQPARSVAIVEAIVGQLYLVVLVARFVGLHAGINRAVRPPDQEP